MTDFLFAEDELSKIVTDFLFAEDDLAKIVTDFLFAEDELSKNVTDLLLQRTNCHKVWWISYLQRTSSPKLLRISGPMWKNGNALRCCGTRRPAYGVGSVSWRQSWPPGRLSAPTCRRRPPRTQGTFAAADGGDLVHMSFSLKIEQLLLNFLNIDGLVHRRKGKVRRVFLRGRIYNKFLAAPAVLHWTIWRIGWIAPGWWCAAKNWIILPTNRNDNLCLFFCLYPFSMLWW